MGWKLHHVNVPAINVRETAAFYADMIGLRESAMPVKQRDRGIFPVDPQNLAWFEDGQGSHLHVYRPQPNFARDNGFYINPVVNGHVAIEVDDIEAVKRRLNDAEIYYADAGHWALQDRYQIYLHDPALNVVEVNQPL